MVLGYHVVFCTYGFWLPNDPRGSWSDYVGALDVLRFGPATKTDSHRSVAGSRHDPHRRKAAKAALKYSPVSLSGIQARAVGRGFNHYIARVGIKVWACSILPQHVHAVIARDNLKIEQIINLLKGHATRQLLTEEIQPKPTCWSRGHWKVFLNTEQDIRRAIRYVQNNPSKDGLPPQRWSFVQEYIPVY